jgi:hypothetical protein
MGFNSAFKELIKRSTNSNVSYISLLQNITLFMFERTLLFLHHDTEKVSSKFGYWVLRKMLCCFDRRFFCYLHPNNGIVYMHQENLIIELQTFFDVHRAVHRNIISIVIPKRCTNVCNLFYFRMTLYMFRTVFPSIMRSSRLYIQQQAFVKQILLFACLPSETCRMSFQNKINFIH